MIPYPAWCAQQKLVPNAPQLQSHLPLIHHPPQTLAAATHIAIVHRRYANLILAGVKSVEARLSITKRPPFASVRTGDTIFLKVSGQGYIAHARAQNVLSFSGLTPKGVQTLRSAHNPIILATPHFWHAKRRAKYATLIWLSNIQPDPNGPPIPRLHGDAWKTISNPTTQTPTTQPLPPHSLVKHH